MSHSSVTTRPFWHLGFLWILSTDAWDCRAEIPWPTGEIRDGDGLHERLALGRIQPDELSEIRVVRFSDTLESLPTEWLTVKEAEQEVITLDADFKIMTASLVRAGPTDGPSKNEPRQSPCPVYGALVALPRLPSQEIAIVFFKLHDENMLIVSPSGWSVSNEELHKFLTKRFPKLLRATRGARLAREDIAESDISVERVYFRDGALRMQVPLRDGKRHGLGCSMFKSGGVSLLLPYSLGRIEGTVKSFAEGGTLLSETPYESGQRHGAERFFNEDGRLIGTTWWFRGGLVQEENLEKHTEEAPPSRKD
jgi:hypothetical protein